MSVLREIPFGGRFHRPRLPEMSFEEAMDASDDPLILQHEFDGSPICDITIGRVHVVDYKQSSQLILAVSLIENFIQSRENWTRDKEDYLESEKNFAKDLFTVLCYVKRNIDWRVGGKPPLTGTRTMGCFAATISSRSGSIGAAVRRDEPLAT